MPIPSVLPTTGQPYQLQSPMLLNMHSSSHPKSLDELALELKMLEKSLEKSLEGDE